MRLRVATSAPNTFRAGRCEYTDSNANSRSHRSNGDCHSHCYNNTITDEHRCHHSSSNPRAYGRRRPNNNSDYCASAHDHSPSDDDRNHS